MLVFDKQEIRDALTEENMFELFQEVGGDPEISNFGIISSTICHNKPGEGSKKLYWYSNTGLCRCYTGCEEPVFDIFELVIKVMAIQHNQEFDLNDAVRWIAAKFGFQGTEENDDGVDKLEDWKYLANYQRIEDIESGTKHIVLKEYEPDILDRFNYKIKLTPWLREGIAQKVLTHHRIGFYPGGSQITIPHYDVNDRFIGLRGRTIIKEDGERYGKYRPIKINNLLYNHPLGMNLYNLNNSKKAINILGKAIVFEGEKSALKYSSFFGVENDISVACCGSNLSKYQVQLLEEAGAKEIIIAFDRQFQDIGDDEFKKLKRNLMNLNDKYCKEVNISFMFDKNKITGYKDSPIDCGKEIFMKLFKERIQL